MQPSYHNFEKKNDRRRLTRMPISLAIDSSSACAQKQRQQFRGYRWLYSHI